MNLALRDVVEATVGQRPLAGHRASGPWNYAVPTACQRASRRSTVLLCIHMLTCGYVSP